jgi:cytochrome P450
MRTFFATSPQLMHQVLVTDAPKFHKGRMRQRRMMQPAFHRDRVAGHANVMAPGTEVILSPHVPHPANYPAPERARQLPRGAFVPFGGGIHRYIGNHCALTEIVIAVATVCSHHRLVPDRPVRTKFTNAVYPVGLLMKAVPR